MTHGSWGLLIAPRPMTIRQARAGHLRHGPVAELFSRQTTQEHPAMTTRLGPEQQACGGPLRRIGTRVPEAIALRKEREPRSRTLRFLLHFGDLFNEELKRFPLPIGVYRPHFVRDRGQHLVLGVLSGLGLDKSSGIEAVLLLVRFLTQAQPPSFEHAQPN